MSWYSKLVGIGSTLFLVDNTYTIQNDRRLSFFSGFKRKILCETNNDLITPEKKLIYSTVYFRHGTRTPLNKLRLFPKLEWSKPMCEIDTSSNFLPYKIVNIDDGTEGRPLSYFDQMYTSIELPGGCLAGHLTKKGQQDSLNLGNILKQRYIDQTKLVDDIYDSTTVFLYTTNLNRTVESMQAVLKGMFGDSINSKNIAIINTRPNEIEHNFPNSQFCERVGKWMNYAYSAQYSLRVCDGLRDKLSRLFIDPSEIPQPIELWDNVASMKSNGFELPQEYEELYGEIEKCASHAEKYAIYGDIPETMTQSFGKVIDDILCHFEQVSTNNSHIKLNLTACHDTTILALLIAMGGFNEKWPSLSCYIAFELYNDSIDSKYYVRVFYNGDIVRSSGTDNLGFIPLEKFADKHERIRMRDDFKNYCRSFTPSSD